MSEFGDKFAAGMPKLLEKLGSSTTITLLDGSSITRTGVFDRAVYQIDHTQDATWHFTESATTGLTKAQAQRGIAITEDSTSWIAVDVRRDEDGGFEIVCKAPELVP